MIATLVSRRTLACTQAPHTHAWSFTTSSLLPIPFVLFRPQLDLFLYVPRFFFSLAHFPYQRPSSGVLKLHIYGPRASRNDDGCQGLLSLLLFLSHSLGLWCSPPCWTVSLSLPIQNRQQLHQIVLLIDDVGVFNFPFRIICHPSFGCHNFLWYWAISWRSVWRPPSSPRTFMACLLRFVSTLNNDENDAKAKSSNLHIACPSPPQWRRRQGLSYICGS